MTGRGGDSRGRAGVKVLEDGVNAGWQGESGDKQVVELIHDELLHAFQGILELGVGGVSPHV